MLNAPVRVVVGFLHVVVLGLFLCGVPGSAQSLDDVIPFDAAVKTGTLSNGLKYYIRHNGRPEKRVAMRLAVKAGSLDEADDQQGLAHMLEHMAFNGTTHFKPGELVAYFESTGTRLGPHVNAYTSFRETVYMLQLPTDKEGLVEKGFTALADYAGGMTLDPKEIDKERGVVLEEWRLGLGAQSRIRDKQIPVLYYRSRYAERLPIGKPDVLKTFKPDRLRNFYETYYRPDRMAVVVVGDVDVAAMERLIRQAFEGLKNPSTPVPPRQDEVPLHAEELVNVATDPEAQRSSVTIIRKRPAEPDGRVRDYRRDLIQHLIAQMVNDRFEELAQKPDATFLGAGAFGDSLSPSVDTFDLAATVPDGGIQAGMVAIATEAERVRQFGFNPAEFDRVKKTVLPNYERAYAERDKTESASFADEYVRNFLDGEPSPGIGYELEIVKKVLPGISLEEANSMAKGLLAEGSTVVLAVSPQKPNIAIPTADQLAASLKATETTPVTAWAEAETRTELLEKKPAPGTVADRREIPELGVTIVKFSNGVEAWLKPTDFKNDQVVFTMYARGGSSLAPPERFVEASLAPAFVTLSGVAGLKATDLPKVLAGKLAEASPFVTLSTHGISGSSTPGDLETALQLLYAEFTQPRDDTDAFTMLKRQLDAAVVNRQQNPGVVFGQRVARINSSGHYTTQPLTSERVAALDRATMASFYRERFANAADFTLFVVGNLNLDSVVPLLARYVGSLPSAESRTSDFRNVGIRFPDAVVRETVKKGSEPRTQTAITFDAEPPVDEAEVVRLRAAVDVLQLVLRDILREQLGQTYTVSASYTDARPQEGTGRVMITFGAAPENAAAMAERVLQEVKRMQAEPASVDYVTRTKESSRRARETAERQNGYWLGDLQSKHLLGRDPRLMLEWPKWLDTVTPESVQAMFKRYFNFERYTIVTLVPEK
jgi:zinc protease